MTRAASHNSLVSTWAGTRAQTLDIMVAFSDEPPFTKGLPRVAGFSTMITCACPWRGPIGAATSRRIRGGGLCGSAFDTTAAATSYRCQSTSSYQVTCTACSPATVSITASVSALAGRPG